MANEGRQWGLKLLYYKLDCNSSTAQTVRKVNSTTLSGKRKGSRIFLFLFPQGTFLSEKMQFSLL